MTETEIEDSDSISLKKSYDRPELISIRQKLVAPNNILPGIIHKSQLPIHILPISTDF